MLEYNKQLLPTLTPTKWKQTKHRSINWCHHRGLNKLFQRSNNNKWFYYTQSTRRGRQNTYPTYHFSGVLNSLPSETTPASVNFLSINSVKYEGTMPFEPNIPHQIPNTLAALIKSIPPNQQHPLLDLNNTSEIPHIISSIQQGNCAMVSDDSYFPESKQSAAAFIFGNEAAHRRIIGRCHTHGPTSSFSSYRAELAGLHGGIMFLHAICQLHQIKEGRIIIGCDNEGAIKRIKKGQPRLQNKNFDYLSAIFELLKDIQIHIQFVHVEGHRDRIISSDHLTILESMNVSADTHAKVKATSPKPNGYSETAEIYKEWSAILHQDRHGNKSRIHSSLDTSLYELLTQNTTRTYWEHKMKIPRDAAQTINWPSLSLAFTELPKNKQKEVLKWHSGFCGTNAALKLWKQSNTAECPGCNHPKETTTHIIKCKAPGATEIWNNEIEKLAQWMNTNKAAPEITEAVISGLEGWRNNQQPHTKRFNLPFLNIAIAHQNRIGWKCFLHGFTSKYWELAQQTFLQFKSSRTTGKRWISSLIKKLWETIWALWRYRNGLVHEQSNTPLKKINALLNITILKELQTGLSGLPRNYAYLFKKQSTAVLKTSLNQKKQWVLTIWVARDTHTPTHISIIHRHPIINSILTSWKTRIHQYEQHQSNRR